MNENNESKSMRVGTTAKEKAEKERKAAGRRRALRAFMTERDLSAATLAKKAGLHNANTLYNFLNGHSASMSQPTIEKLAKAAGASSAEMFGEGQAISRQAPVIISRVRAESHNWRPSYEIAGRIQGNLAIPPGVDIDEAVVIGDDHCDQIYPKGTIAGVTSLTALGRRGLIDGDKVLFHRIRGTQHEVTIRQLEVAPNSHSAELLFRSTDRRFSSRLPVGSWPYVGAFWEQEGDRCQVRGRVILGVIVDEDA
jgi:transcriptional regulator with XRE-family HTH domain